MIFFIFVPFTGLIVGQCCQHLGVFNLTNRVGFTNHITLDLIRTLLRVIRHGHKRDPMIILRLYSITNRDLYLSKYTTNYVHIQVRVNCPRLTQWNSLGKNRTIPDFYPAGKSRIVPKFYVKILSN